MKKGINRTRVSLLFMMLLILMFASVEGFASDFNNMSIREKTDWIMENVPAENFKGERKIETGKIGERSSGWIYSREHVTYASNYHNTLGRLEGQIRWESDYRENVTSFQPYVHRNVILGPLVESHKNYDGYLANNKNARLSLEAEFIDFSGRYVVIQVYNAHGDGTYEYREF